MVEQPENSPGFSAAEVGFTMEHHGATLLVRMRVRELTMFHLPELRADVLAALRERPERIVFDFGPTVYIDSSAIALIFKVQSEIAGYGGKMAVSGIRPTLSKVLRSVVRRQEIEFYDTLEEALRGAE
jgi:anti-anti-sigma factor